MRIETGSVVVDRSRRSPGRRVWWGLVLITLGVLFMLDRYGVIQIGTLWRWWPLLLIASGLGHMLWPDRGQHWAKGVFPIGMGFWFLACQDHWYGLSYSNGWPVIMVLAGISMLFRNVAERNHTENDVEEEERHV